MSRSLRVLFVEDSAEETALLVRQLRRGGYDPTFARVDSADALDAALGEQTWDIILAEYTLSRFRPHAALNQLKERGLDLPFIIVSGDIGEDHAASAIKAGADDYINRENLTRLVLAAQFRRGGQSFIEREVTSADVVYHETLSYVPGHDLIQMYLVDVTERKHAEEERARLGPGSSHQAARRA